MTFSADHTIVNDAIAIYFADATLAAPFVARWCAGATARHVVAGFHRVRDDQPETRRAAALHRTPGE